MTSRLKANRGGRVASMEKCVHAGSAAAALVARLKERHDERWRRRLEELGGDLNALAREQRQAERDRCR